MDFASGLVNMFSSMVVKSIRHDAAFSRFAGGKQLVVVSCDSSHWLFDVLCQYRRTTAGQQVIQARKKSKEPLEKIKLDLLLKLLESNKHVEVSSFGAFRRSSELVQLAAALVSEIEVASEFEPLLVEVALTNTLRSWSHNSRGTSVAEFEDALLKELKGPDAQNWFGCQFFIDTLDLLTLSPFFYKTRLENQATKDVISRCILDCKNDLDVLAFKIAKRLTKPKNKAAFDAWMAWVGEDVVTVGSPSRRAASNDAGLATLRDMSVNATLFAPDKLGYFPILLDIKGARSKEMDDHCATIEPSTSGDNVFGPGFIYQGVCKA